MIVDRASCFEDFRPRLRGLAYRMLGSVGDAEDIVQDAFLRWHRADGGGEAIRSPEAWLVTVVTHLCLDRLRAVAVERAAYEGPWLPEPWPGATEDVAPDRRLVRATDLSLAFLLLPERLSPEERAAFLLREVFDVGYPEIARALGRTEAGCRQMVHRARERLRQDRPRHAATEADRRRLVRQYLDAVDAGDQATLLRILAPMPPSSPTAAARSGRCGGSCVERSGSGALWSRSPVRCPAWSMSRPSSMARPAT